MNLLKADFYQIVREKILYILMIALAGLSFAVCYVYHQLDINGDVTADSVILKCIGSDTLCTVVGVAVAFLCGREYELNTIRNKICCGESRYKILFTKLIEGFVIAAVLFAVAVGTGLVMGKVWFVWEFREDFWQIVGCQGLIVLAFVCVVTSLCVLTKNVRIPLITVVVCFVVLNPMSMFLPSMIDNDIVPMICRGVYMIASNMLLNSTDGVYEVNQWSQDGIITYAYEDLYLNCILIAVCYLVISVAVSMLVMRKQEYK